MRLAPLGCVLDPERHQREARGRYGDNMGRRRVTVPQTRRGCEMTSSLMEN